LRDPSSLDEQQKGLAARLKVKYKDLVSVLQSSPDSLDTLLAEMLKEDPNSLPMTDDVLRHSALSEVEFS
jgi:hypothetical protein